MANDRPHDPQGEKESAQALAKIQHSRAHDEKQEPNRKQAAVVADPRKRLVDGKVDPATNELKPAK